MARDECRCCKEGYNLNIYKAIGRSRLGKADIEATVRDETKAEAICGKMGIWCRYLVKASVVMEKRPTNRLAASDS